jgi:hypothetical protein
MSSIKFEQLIGELSSRFDRVDVRFACFRKGDEWVNYAASIRFLCADTSTVPKAKPIVTQHFRTCYAGGTIEDDWKDFQQAFASGKVQLQGVTVTMQPAVDLATLNCNLSKYSTYFTEKEWPQYSAAINRRDAGPDQETMNRASFEVTELGYRDIYQAVSTSLRVYLDQSMNVGYDIFVSVPIYAKIDSIAFDGSVLMSIISFHDRLDGARLIVHLLPGDGWGPRSGPIKEDYALYLKSTEAENLGNSIRRVTLTTKLREAGINDRVDCRLLLGGLILDEESDQVSRLLLKHPDKIFGVEFPLLSVLDRFCSVDNLSKQLLSPEKLKRSAKLFERAVSWLLASSGAFCVVKLDDFEKLIIKDSNFTKGSADLLAYAPAYSVVYVISCTVTLPQDRDIAGIMECADYLSKEIFADRPTKLRAVLVTAQTDTIRVREECIKRGVQLVDGNDMMSLVEKLRLSDAKGFRGFWGLY